MTLTMPLMVRRMCVKLSLLILGTTLLAACASGGGVEGASIAPDAFALMLSSRPAEQIVQCISEASRGTPQPMSGGYVIAQNGQESSYRVTTFADPLHRYITRVDVLGSGAVPDAVSICMAPRDPA